MKRLTLFKHSAFATLLMSAALTAFAGGGGSAAPKDNQFLSSYSASAQRSATTTTVAAVLPADGTASTASSAAALQETPAATRSTSSGKTRAQVREELVEAQRAGLVPSSKDYPPGAATIARNQARFQQVEPFWRARGDLSASGQ